MLQQASSFAHFSSHQINCLRVALTPLLISSQLTPLPITPFTLLQGGKFFSSHAHAEKTYTATQRIQNIMATDYGSHMAASECVYIYCGRPCNDSRKAWQRCLLFNHKNPFSDMPLVCAQYLGHLYKLCRSSDHLYSSSQLSNQWTKLLDSMTTKIYYTVLHVCFVME